MADRGRLRPAGFDDLGLRLVLGDRVLPLLVAAMSFLAALACGGAVAAAALGQHWRAGAGSAVTVQVPQPAAPAAPQPAAPAAPQPAAPSTDLPGASRLDRTLAELRATPGVAEARALSEAELAKLLRPWLGDDPGRLALPLPAVIAVRLDPSRVDTAALAGRLALAAPGVLLESHGIWVERLSVLARSLQACALLALGVVTAVAAAVIAVATRAGLAARREAIEIVHSLGATDGYIAGRFAGRAARLAALGGVGGGLAALPVLLALASLAAPFAATAQDAPAVASWPAVASLIASLPAPAAWVAALVRALPESVWLALPLLPLAAAAIGFATAQLTVRRWLRRLP